MIVNIKGLGSGVAHAAQKVRPATAVHPSAPAPQELFDANGDGRIENWSVLHGGDSFATLSPPPPGSEPSPSRSGPPGAPAPNHTDTPAAVHHAHDAYRRDGMASPPGAPVVTHAPAPPAGAVPQPTGGVPLRSSA